MAQRPHGPSPELRAAVKAVEVEYDELIKSLRAMNDLLAGRKSRPQLRLISGGRDEQEAPK
jgi:hypothetical protein